MKYADDFVLLAKEEKMLQDMIDKLIEIGRCYGMEMNAEKRKLMRILRQPFPVKIMIDQKQLENVEYSEKISLDLEEEKELGMQLGC